MFLTHVPVDNASMNVKTKKNYSGTFQVILSNEPPASMFFVWVEREIIYHCKLRC